MSSTKTLIDTIILAAYDVYVKRALNLKADKSTVSALTSTVNSKADKTTVEALESSISSKANQSDLTALETTVKSKASQSQLELLEIELDSKADQTDLDALIATVNSKANKDTVNALAEIIETKADKTELEAKADQTTVDALSTRVTNLENSSGDDSGSGVDQSVIDELTEAINSKADQSDLDALTTTVNAKANQSDLNDLNDTVEGMSEIVNEKATQEDLDDVEARVTNLENNVPETYDPTFKIIERKSFGTSGTLYINLSTYMANYSELMIVIRSVVNAETTIGISNTTSGTSFITSTAVSGTKYTKLVMNKTDEGNYAWTIGSSFGWSTSADYKYLKYSGSATSVSISAVIHGR